MHDKCLPCDKLAWYKVCSDLSPNEYQAFVCRMIDLGLYYFLQIEKN